MTTDAAPASISALIAEGRRLIEAATPGPVETSLHEKLTTVGDTNHWTVKEHEFPQPPYEGQLTEEWGVYPPLGEAGPVALVSGPHNAALFVFAVNNLAALLDVAEAAVEWEAADAEQRRVPAWSRDTDLFERMLFRSQSATRALRAAVRGEEKTS